MTYLHILARDDDVRRAKFGLRANFINVHVARQPPGSLPGGPPARPRRSAPAFYARGAALL